MVALVTVASQVLLFLLIAGMAGSCDADLCMLQFKKVRGIVAGLCCHYLVMPFLGYLAFLVAPFSKVTRITLLLVTASPSGGFSGLWCSLCNADLALSVAVTTASTLVSVPLMPAFLAVLSRLGGMHLTLDWWSIAASVAVVVLAVPCGLYLAAKLDRTGRGAVNRVGSFAGAGLIVLSLFANASSDDHSARVWNKSGQWWAAVSMPVPVGLVITTWASRAIFHLDKPECVTIGIESVFQNTALALAVALSAFPESQAGEASAVGLVYGGAELAFIFFFALGAWKAGWTHCPTDAGFIEALRGDYQPEATEEEATRARGLSNASRTRGWSEAESIPNLDATAALEAPLVFVETPAKAPPPPTSWWDSLFGGSAAVATDDAGAARAEPDGGRSG